VIVVTVDQLLGLGLTAAAVAAIVNQIAKPKEATQKCEDKKPCPPCVPPVGSLAYRIDVVPPSKPHKPFKGSHIHIYKQNQSPVEAGCKCFWSEIDVIDGNSPPPLGARPF